jgi:hypothetical protein
VDDLSWLANNKRLRSWEDAFKILNNCVSHNHFLYFSPLKLVCVRFHVSFLN